MPDDRWYREPELDDPGLHPPEHRSMRRSRMVGAETPAPPRDPGYPYPGRPQPRSQPWSDTSPQTNRGRTWLLVLLGAVGVVLIAVVVNLAFREFGADEEPIASDAVASADDQTDDADPADTDTATATGDQAQDAPTDATPVPLAPPATGPYIQFEFDGRFIVMRGTVMSNQQLEELVQGAEFVYSPPAVTSELVVDETLSDAGWLAAATEVAPLLQIIGKANAIIADGQITVSGESKSTDDVALLERLIAERTGLPVNVEGIVITNKRPALFVLALSNGSLAMSGSLPTDEIRQGFVGSAVEIYGQDNVIDASSVDPTIETELWMFDPGPFVGTVAVFSDFEIRFEGDRVTSRLSGGPTFGAGSADVSPELAQVLDFGILAMSREPTMTVEVRGHTDSSGPDDMNLTLSQARAKAAADYYIAGGIDPSRVSAVGLGEAEPIDTNDTPEGRERNRRIELVVDTGGG